MLSPAPPKRFSRGPSKAPNIGGHGKPPGPIRHSPPGARTQDRDTSKGEKPSGKQLRPDPKPPEEISTSLLSAHSAAAGIFLAPSFLSYGPRVRLPGVRIRSRFCSKSSNIFCMSWSASITWKLNTQSQPALASAPPPSDGERAGGRRRQERQVTAKQRPLQVKSQFWLCFHLRIPSTCPCSELRHEFLLVILYRLIFYHEGKLYCASLKTHYSSLSLPGSLTARQSQEWSV